MSYTDSDDFNAETNGPIKFIGEMAITGPIRASQITSNTIQDGLIDIPDRTIFSNTSDDSIWSLGGIKASKFLFRDALSNEITLENDDDVFTYTVGSLTRPLLLVSNPGDLLTSDGNQPIVLSRGSSDQVLTVSNNQLSWKNPQSIDRFPFKNHNLFAYGSQDTNVSIQAVDLIFDQPTYHSNKAIVSELDQSSVFVKESGLYICFINTCLTNNDDDEAGYISTFSLRPDGQTTFIDYFSRVSYSTLNDEDTTDALNLCIVLALNTNDECKARIRRIRGSGDARVEPFSSQVCLVKVEVPNDASRFANMLCFQNDIITSTYTTLQCNVSDQNANWVVNQGGLRVTESGLYLIVFQCGFDSIFSDSPVSIEGTMFRNGSAVGPKAYSYIHDLTTRYGTCTTLCLVDLNSNDLLQLRARIVSGPNVRNLQSGSNFNPILIKNTTGLQDDVRLFVGNSSNNFNLDRTYNNVTWTQENNTGDFTLNGDEIIINVPGCYSLNAFVTLRSRNNNDHVGFLRMQNHEVDIPGSLSCTFLEGNNMFSTTNSNVSYFFATGDKITIGCAERSGSNLEFFEGYVVIMRLRDTLDISYPITYPIIYTSTQLTEDFTNSDDYTEKLSLNTDIIPNGQYLLTVNFQHFAALNNSRLGVRILLNNTKVIFEAIDERRQRDLYYGNTKSDILNLSEGAYTITFFYNSPRERNVGIKDVSIILQFLV